MSKTSTATKPAATKPAFEMVKKQHIADDRYRVTYKLGEKSFTSNVRLSSLQAEIKQLEKMAGKQAGTDKTRTEEVLASKTWLATQLETEGAGKDVETE